MAAVIKIYEKKKHLNCRTTLIDIETSILNWTEFTCISAFPFQVVQICAVEEMKIFSIFSLSIQKLKSIFSKLFHISTQTLDFLSSQRKEACDEKSSRIWDTDCKNEDHLKWSCWCVYMQAKFYRLYFTFLINTFPTLILHHKNCKTMLIITTLLITCDHCIQFEVHVRDSTLMFFHLHDRRTAVYVYVCQIMSVADSWCLCASCAGFSPLNMYSILHC